MSDNPHRTSTHVYAGETNVTEFEVRAWDRGFAAGRAAERAANVKLLREEAAATMKLGSFERDALQYAAAFLARSSVPSDPKETNDE